MISRIFSAHKCGWHREPKACQPDYNWCIWYQIQDTWYLILMVFDRIKVREFNLPRHRKLNLINHQRFRLPDDQFDSDRWDPNEVITMLLYVTHDLRMIHICRETGKGTNSVNILVLNFPSHCYFLGKAHKKKCVTHWCFLQCLKPLQ